MGRMSELSAAVDEIRECGERLVGIADSLTQLYGRANEAQKAATTSTQSEAVKPKPPTLEEVRGFLADKSRAGHTAAIKEIIRSHGAERLSVLDPTEFTAVLAEAGGLK